MRRQNPEAAEARTEATPWPQTWAVAECLRCRGVCAAVAALPASPALSRVQARRLQLSAERGGGVGLLLRPLGLGGRAPPEHAAATRWVVRPAPGERTVQWWQIQLIYGHGGRVGQAVILENRRGTDIDDITDTEYGAGAIEGGFARMQAQPVRTAEDLAGRPLPPAAVARPQGHAARPARFTA